MEHKTYNGLSITTIREYLDAAKICIETRKSNGGIVGMAALVLLTSSIDAVGSYYKKDKSVAGGYCFDNKVDMGHVSTAVKNHFYAVYSVFFDDKDKFPEMQDLNKENFITLVFDNARNKAVHNAVVSTFIATDESGKRTLASKDNKDLYVDVLYDCVERAFEMFILNHPDLIGSPIEGDDSSVSGVTSSNIIQQA